MSVKYLKKNAQTLNINTILYSNPRKKYGGQNTKYMTKYRMLNKFSNGEGNKTGDYQDLMSMNNVVNNNI